MAVHNYQLLRYQWVDVVNSTNNRRQVKTYARADRFSYLLSARMLYVVYDPSQRLAVVVTFFISNFIEHLEDLFLVQPFHISSLHIFY